MEFIDQLSRAVFIPEPPNRIVSLVPSQTELLVDLGLRDALVGVTKFCVHPEGLKNEKAIIGGTKNFSLEKIEALRPDLIIGNKEENQKEGIESLAKKYPVWMSDIHSFEDSLNMIARLGEITNTRIAAARIISDLNTELENNLEFKGTAVYLIWNDPIMVAGSDTFIDNMMAKAGFENLVRQARYPELSMTDLIELDPEFLLLSSEPFPFKQKHITKFRELLPNSKVKLVDGEMFSWYGSRLQHAASYFRTL